jgi:hypothetical protein
MMRRFSKPFIFINAAYIIAGVSLPLLAEPLHATGSYDGERSVVIETMRGDCPAAIRAGVRILGGKVLAEDPSYSVGGYVAANGAVRVNVSAGGRDAGGFGHLWRNAGRGLWQTQSGECSRQWNAARRVR